MFIENFKDLVVWQKAMLLVREVYLCTKKLPQSELYGLISQIRRSSVSIPSNIAEGKKRGTRKDYIQFLRISNGSAAELETQLIVAKDIYPDINLSTCFELLEEVQKMLNAIIKKLNALQATS